MSRRTVMRRIPLVVLGSLSQLENRILLTSVRNLAPATMLPSNRRFVIDGYVSALPRASFSAPQPKR
jgi:hypothetical protein